jgi:hypothetical protein
MSTHLDRVRAELLASGKRAAYKNQCDSVIVAPDHTGADNYHNCTLRPRHTERPEFASKAPILLHESAGGYVWNASGEILVNPHVHTKVVQP